ncbi:hypothetical protein JOE25_000796 [Serratia sp. PL17]|uniref:hypothetical protein n=1 Tax=Serratia sp. PL17 TaxID=2806582 RepID=UPI001AE36575|nr:hypothetical protein [Serratia sp. PL17]MBP1129253.1 hypothetical protein [Serratia sp. PL17]
MNIETIIVSALISIVIAWLTMRLALYRFYREKWWDKKATAYLELIDVLYDFKKDYEIVYQSAFAERFLDQDPNLAFDILSSEKEKNFWIRTEGTHEKLSKIIGLGPLIFTEAALEKLSAFDERGEEVAKAFNDDEFDKLDAYQEISDSADKLYDDFKNIALVELKLKPRHKVILENVWGWMRIQYVRAKDDYNANFK